MDDEKLKIIETRINEQIEALKQQQRDAIEKLARDKAANMNTRRGRRITKQQEAWKQRLEEASGIEYGGDPANDMTPEEIEQALIGASAEIEPDVPRKQKQKSQHKGVRLSSKERKAVKAEKAKIKQKAFWDSLMA